jgi:flagellar biosynthesis/type III secretory pathway protein FliH
MTLAFGHVLSPEAAARAARVELPLTPAASVHGRVVPKPIVDAQAEARAILARAEERAREFESHARFELGALREQLLAEARAEGVAALAAQALALAKLEAATDQRALDRLVELAGVLAERLLGEALALDPSRVVALAGQVLKEARGARRITLVAHPDDAPELERALAAGELDHVAEVLADASQGRGNLRLESEIGTLDAELAPQLSRLSRRLREALTHES